MKNLLNIVLLLALVAVGVVWYRQSMAAASLRNSNEDLRRQVEEAAMRNQPLRSAKGTSTDVNVREGSMAELEQLRKDHDSRGTEIEALRAQLAELQSPSNNPALPGSFRTDNRPKDSWTFAGYDTPEAALETMLWATREGNVSALRESLNKGELNRRAQSVWTNKTDEQIAESGRQGLEKATGFQILKSEMLNENMAHFTIYMDGLPQPDQPVWFDVIRVDGQWKAAGYEHHR